MNADEVSDLPAAMSRRLRAFWLRRRGLRIQGKCWLQSIEVPRNHADIQLHNGVALDRGVTLLSTGDVTSKPRIVIGERTYINRHTMIDASDQITIGTDTMIGPFCYITDHDHGTQAGVLIREQPLLGAPVLIGTNSWLGAHVTVLKGVTIGEGCVVGAGSVVTSDLPAQSIAVGVPARVVREREARG